jgi:hypothetical protein
LPSLSGADAKKYPFLQSVPPLPTRADLDRALNDILGSTSGPLKGVLTDFVANLRRALEEFAPLLEYCRQNPNDQAAIQRLNELAQLIGSLQDAIRRGLAFDPMTSTTASLNGLLGSVASARTNAELLPALSDLALALAAVANNTLTDPAKTLVAAEINDASDLILSSPAIAAAELEAIARSLAVDPRDLTLDLLDRLLLDLRKSSGAQLKRSAVQLLTADRTARALNGLGNALLDPVSFQSRLVRTASALPDGTPSAASLEELQHLLGQLSDSLIQAGDVSSVPDADVPDRVSDALSDFARLSQGLVGELKRTSGFSPVRVSKALQQMRLRALNVAELTVQTASKRPHLPGEVTADLQGEVLTLLENLENLQRATASAEHSTDRTRQARAVAKANREIAQNLDNISDLCDEVLDAPTPAAGSGAADTEDYRAHSNAVLNDVVKLAGASLETNDGARTKRVTRVMQTLRPALATFRASAVTVSAGTPDAEDISGILRNLEGLLEDVQRPGAPLPFSVPKRGAMLVNEVRRHVADALSTDVVAQPGAVASLPVRFSLPAVAPGESRPIQELKGLVDRHVGLAGAALQKFVAGLNHPKVAPDVVQRGLADVHQSLTALVAPLAQLRASTWNPQCGAQLGQLNGALIAVGDLAIDAARARLVAGPGWRDTVAQFVGQASATFERASSAAAATLQAAQADLAVTNEAEKELVVAARAIAESQVRLANFKAVAEQKKVTIGEGYIGCEIVDIAAPILATAAELIGAAQRQTQYLLSINPTLPNQAGLVKTAGGLVDSLELILVAAEATVNYEQNSIEKVLAASNIISSAVAHFLAECHQKNGDEDINGVMTNITDSIQGMIRKLRAFGETAYQAREEKAEALEAAKRPKTMNQMVATLNAEGKVSEARKALESAELALKKLRQTLK